MDQKSKLQQLIDAKKASSVRIKTEIAPVVQEQTVKKSISNKKVVKIKKVQLSNIKKAIKTVKSIANE